MSVKPTLINIKLLFYIKERKINNICKNCLWFTTNPYNTGYDVCDSPEECFHGDEFVLASAIKSIDKENEAYK